MDIHSTPNNGILVKISKNRIGNGYYHSELTDSVCSITANTKKTYS